ncbi:unnamed protein product [Acanthoscelides obtectus]|uniref:Uncharacterized protein n=1 Tax=Acanthoscelides obtectus TaxID=200917 RepID=A0A9P0Q4I2_ACAOB|nr:unnamed protein product [Acanthoscelides obtectus]CAK1627294.1 hypothetical protein AOBTE_LOCUS4491 [Acanthoscelides obtectus]
MYSKEYHQNRSTIMSGRAKRMVQMACKSDEADCNRDSVNITLLSHESARENLFENKHLQRDENVSAIFESGGETCLENRPLSENIAMDNVPSTNVHNSDIHQAVNILAVCEDDSITIADK